MAHPGQQQLLDNVAYELPADSWGQRQAEISFGQYPRGTSLFDGIDPFSKSVPAQDQEEASRYNIEPSRQIQGYPAPENMSSPTSSYAASYISNQSIQSPRHQSFSHQFPPSFQFSENLNMNRRVSSPAIITNPHLFQDATNQGIADAHFAFPSNFSFGPPSRASEATQRYVSQQQQQRLRQHVHTQAHTQAQARVQHPNRGLSSDIATNMFGAQMHVPANMEYERRMSHPVLPTASPPVSPHNRIRQVSMVDWNSTGSYRLPTKTIATPSRFADSLQSSRNETFWNAMESARGIAATSSQMNQGALSKYLYAC